MKVLIFPSKSKIIQFSLSIVSLVGLFMGSNTASADIEIEISKLTDNGQGRVVGTVIARDTEDGLLFIPDLSGLPPGPHGFHIHENPSCLNAGNAAGGHYDPEKTSKHLGPEGNGHLGDLPPLYVDANGNANLEVIAPRLKEKDIRGHSLIIHEGGDNFSDEPLPLGGGGARIACGVIPK